MQSSHGHRHLMCRLQSAFGDRRELLHECAKPRFSAPNKNKTNPRKNLEFVLFFTRDYFGLKIKL